MVSICEIGVFASCLYPEFDKYSFRKRIYQKTGRLYRKAERLFTSDRFGTAGEWRKSSVLENSDGREGGTLWVAKVLLIFRIIVTGDSESSEYAFLQHMEVTCSIYIW